MVGALIYVRVSTKEQTQNLSLPTQLRRGFDDGDACQCDTFAVQSYHEL